MYICIYIYIHTQCCRWVSLNIKGRAVEHMPYAFTNGRVHTFELIFLRKIYKTLLKRAHPGTHGAHENTSLQCQITANTVLRQASGIMRHLKLTYTP